MILPRPDEPYDNWTKFLAALWDHGRANPDEDILRFHVTEASEGLKGSLLDSSGPAEGKAFVRPSAFLSCARQTYAVVQGLDPQPMPPGIGLTFGMGHLFHELSYAFVRSALPPGFMVHWEEPADMPSWWPGDHERFAKAGTRDLILEVQPGDEDLAAHYVADEGSRVLVDFKTMIGFMIKKLQRTAPGTDPDGFGYTAQAAVYRGDADHVVIAGIDRGQLMAPLVPRKVPPFILDSEGERVRAAVEGAVAGDDPGREFLDRWGSDANFYCGKGGKPGYCPFRAWCADHEPPGEDDDAD